MKKQKKYITICCIICILLFCITGCNQKEDEELYEDLKVETQIPAKESIANYGEFIGTVEAGKTVSVVTKVSGEVLQTYFSEGDMIQEGDLLFDIDSTQAEQGISSAKAAYQMTKSSVNKMLGSGLDSQAISITGTYKNAEIGLDTANYNYSNTCEKIGDTKDSISEMETALDELKRLNADLNQKLQAAIAVSANSVSVSQLSAQISALEAQISTLNASVNTMTSTKGQLESSIHTYENAVKQAGVGMEMAETTLNLTVTKILNEAIASATATLNQAQVNVNNAEAVLDYYHVKSPVSGKLDIQNVEQYEMVQIGNPACSITTDNSKKVIFYVSESNISDIRTGQNATLEYGSENYEGSIIDIDNSVDKSTGLFKVETAVSGSGSGLHVGSSIKVRLETSSEKDAMTIPLEAVYYEDEQAYVYLNIDGVAKKTYVKTGIYDNEKIQVIDGLDFNSQVIISWSARLKDGERVNGIN